MLYSDFKAIYETSGPVAAALVINEIEDVKFDVIAYDYPDIAHVVAVENMDSHGIKIMLGRDIKWLNRIDTSRLNIYAIRSLLLEHPFLQLDTSCLTSGDWSWLLDSANRHRLIENHRDAIFQNMKVMPWQMLCLRHSELREWYDPTRMMNIMQDSNQPAGYRYYLASLTVSEAINCCM
jgi:hypothetical protein